MGLKRGGGMIRCIQSGSRSRRVDERRLGDGDLNKLEDLNIVIAKSEQLKILFRNSKKQIQSTTFLGIKKDVMGIKRGVEMIRCIQSRSRSRRVDERRLGDGDLNELEDLNIAIVKSEEFKLSFSNPKSIFIGKYYHF